MVRLYCESTDASYDLHSNFDLKLLLTPLRPFGLLQALELLLVPILLLWFVHWVRAGEHLIAFRPFFVQGCGSPGSDRKSRNTENHGDEPRGRKEYELGMRICHGRRVGSLRHLS